MQNSTTKSIHTLLKARENWYLYSNKEEKYSELCK